MRYVTTVIIGAGQAGLAMSKHLADRSIDHVLIERGEVANSWRNERWDSLRLLTPNWQSRLPGHAYQGNDPDGFMTMPEVVDYLAGYAATIDAPVETNTTVLSVKAANGGYRVETDRGDWQCSKLVIASGACNFANVPAVATELPEDITSVTPMDYRNPGRLADGNVLVVGASATGVQLAREIQESGRQVTLCAGEHVRLPRSYRGRDIQWWMDETGLLDMDYREVDDIARARRVPSLQLAGTPERRDYDLGSLAAEGVRITGRLMSLDSSKAMLSGSLANHCMLADLKMKRLLRAIDAHIETRADRDGFGEAETFAPTNFDTPPPSQVDLRAEGIKTVIWATGYRPDYSWLQLPVFDRKGRIVHDGGVVNMNGVYVLGLPFLRRRKSSLIDGAGADAADLAEHLGTSLTRAAA